MKHKKIAVIGLGFVGLSLAAVLSNKGYSVVGIDNDKLKCEKILNQEIPFYEKNLSEYISKGLKNNLLIENNYSKCQESEIVFVTVGTPQKVDGSIDLSMIKQVSKEIGKSISKNQKKPIIFIKSTVVPGTAQNIIKPLIKKNCRKIEGKDYDIISNPEFLQETTAIRDTTSPHIVVIGHDNSKFFEKAKKFFKEIHPNTPMIFTNHQTAEMIKYANNSFLATKISFINQLSNMCQKIPGSNIDDISHAIGLDPRIGKLFLNAGPGYGGSCLPKDINAIINLSNQLGVKPTLFNAVETINEFQIQHILDIIYEKIRTVKNKKISILGLSFKPETDDIRDSISIKIINKLLMKNAKIYVHDPLAIENTKKVFGNKIYYSNLLKEVLDESHCCLILTGWEQYSKINNTDISKMKNKLIIDSRRILKDSNLKCEYIGIGIGN